MSREDVVALHEWIALLPHADRLLVLMRYGDGLVPAEMAAVLEMEEAEVCERLLTLCRRAKQRLPHFVSCDVCLA